MHLLRAKFGSTPRLGNVLGCLALPKDHIGRVDAKIGQLICEWARIPLFACFDVEKLAAFHFTLFANRSPPSCLASCFYAIHFAGSRGSPAHTYSMVKNRIVAFPELAPSLLIFNNVHYYLYPRLVTAVRVYTPHHPYLHSSEPAGRALNTLTLAFVNSDPVLLPSTNCRQPPLPSHQ